MSTDQKPRTSLDIQAEYNNLAFKSGNLQFELAERKRNLDMINDTLRSLSTEFVAVKAKEDEVAKAVAEAKEQEAQKPAVEEKAAE